MNFQDKVIWWLSKRERIKIEGLQIPDFFEKSGILLFVAQIDFMELMLLIVDFKQKFFSSNFS
ncbi:hypothetical protein A6S26_19775 [Nostoc sp. ATCC 43529]|nr:hypothetical protein A6S26_19775 [Nostoc sp. ATCC 43529]